MAFKYYFKSALSSFVRNGIMTVASFITVSCCLFLFGVFLLFTLNMNSISEQIESQCEIIARIDFDVSAQQQQDIYNTILNLENVKTAELETQEQALTNFKKELGDDAVVLEGLEGKRFLRSSVKISLKDIRKSEEAVKYIQKINGVAEVENRQDIVSKVVKFTAAVKKGSVMAMLILLIIAIFIIQNTIKLSVHARGKEIQIMKFVGATDHFIRMPFVIEGVMIGTLGFIASFVIITFGYNAVISSVSSIIRLFDFVPLQACITPLGISMALFGVLMGALGSGLSIKRHLKV
ncbi:MAG: permease-like cell division protein FtsX [Clostridia bacterium]|nr:permease-like cell division protein FtsX [Clostridia bacterium]